ncbi:hypothetical protein B0H12DRAFT_1091093 [Mycena haematopus]|nr:hypothetical protein B0H12DRAFT_1091093 [Mycena haematopus]
MKAVQRKAARNLNSCRSRFIICDQESLGTSRYDVLKSPPRNFWHPTSAMNISQLLCSPPPSQASAPGRSSNGAPPAFVSDHDSQSSQGSPTPSSPDAYKIISTQYRCGNCRQRGHNRKTCPKPETPKAPPPPTRPRARGCCGLCGLAGHNRTSCRNVGPPPK